MSTLVELCDEKTGEITNKDPYNCQIVAKNASLTSILHHFVGLVAAHGHMRIAPITDQSYLFHESS